jgi:hypothetical protein
MDEGSGTTIADSSGNGQQGTLKNGAGFGSGLSGTALQCDGTDDFADLGGAASLNLAGALTVSAWVNANGMPTAADSGILNLGLLNYALTYHSNGSVYFYIGNGGNNLNTPLSPNAWHLVTGVFDATTLADGMRLYVDGALASSKASSTATTGAAGTLWIGRYASSYFRGRIDNVTLYGADLDDEAVLNEFCSVQALSGADTLPVNCQ